MLVGVDTDKEDGAISTVVIRGSTDNLMDDIERAVDDGVNTFKVLVRVSRHYKSLGLFCCCWDFCLTFR